MHNRDDRRLPSATSVFTKLLFSDLPSYGSLCCQSVPLGTLNAEVVNPPPKPESTVKDINSVARGWRLQNFNSAANKLLSASSRLDAEVESETKYWNEVLAVKEKGWKVCRLPREGSALGVQYGFLEGRFTLTGYVFHN